VESTSLRACWLGRLLRRLRDDQGLTLRFVAAHLGVEFGVLARFERGETALTRDHVVGLLDAYRMLDNQERAAVLELAQQVWQAQGQLDFDGTIPDQAFADVLWLESQACRIHCYSPTTLPDLLNTVDYATQAYLDIASSEQIAARIGLAQQRQQVLQRELEPPEVLVILDEPVLNQRTTDERIWRDQLDHLTDLALLPNVHLRILPSNSARPAGADHAFTVFTLPPPYLGPVVDIPYLGGRLLLEEHAGRYLTAFEHLNHAAVDGGAFINQLNGSIKER
jgi:transcriptional regulator with XRE-family HTH domain